MRRFAVERMSVQLPPPDPHESFGTPAEGLNLDAPVVVFAAGTPSAYDDLVSDRLLDLRPGLFVVVGSA
jgi:hypothetical protein